MAQEQLSRPILDHVLSPSRMEQFLDGSQWRRWKEGASAVIYRSSLHLSIEEELQIKRLSDRWPSSILVFKVPKNSGNSQRQLENELEILLDPSIQPFAVACSSFKTDSFGRRGLLLEEARGYDLEKPGDRAELNEIDLSRIAYQLARVYQRFHDRGVSPNDVRGLVYRTEDWIQPARVVLYDLAWGSRIHTSGIDRHLDVWRDIGEYLKNLQTIFVQVPRFKLRRVQDLINEIGKNPFVAYSFESVAMTIDSSFEYRLSEEFKYFIKRGVEPTSYETAFNPDTSEDETTKLVNGNHVTLMEFKEVFNRFNLKLDPSKFILGKDAYITEGLLASDVQLGVNEHTAHFVELYIGDLIESKGLSTVDEITDYVFSDKFPEVDLEDCLTPHPREGTLLNALLNKLVAQRIII